MLKVMTLALRLRRQPVHRSMPPVDAETSGALARTVALRGGAAASSALAERRRAGAEARLRSRTAVAKCKRRASATLARRHLTSFVVKVIMGRQEDVLLRLLEESYKEQEQYGLFPCPHVQSI